jgi:predicted transglutaminase-like cysteine proteinase
LNPLLQKVFDQVGNCFIYTPDKEQFPTLNYDVWDSHADDVEQGKVFKGDCDDYAMTCAELLVRGDMAPEDVRIAFCVTEMGDGHLVCIGENFVLDNRQRNVWEWDRIEYTWEKSMKMSDPGVWRTMS